MLQQINDLGIGLYSPAEAAFYARVPTATLSRWIFGDSKGAPAVVRQRDDTDEKIVTFLDFIQALAVRAIRIQHRIPLQKIREAVDIARRDFGVEYPFAMKHRTFLLSDGRSQGHGDIVINVGEKLVQVTGHGKKNLVIREVAEVFLKDLAFDGHDLAQRYTAFRMETQVIEMDPRFHFGEPYLPECGYRARALWDAVIAEGGIDPAADAYGVSPEQVELAFRYVDHLKSTNAV